VALASFQEQFDLAGMLRFPVSFSSFYLLYVVFGLADTRRCWAAVLLGI